MSIDKRFYAKVTEEGEENLASPYIENSGNSQHIKIPPSPI
jgi:hypothetical protein